MTNTEKTSAEQFCVAVKTRKTVPVGKERFVGGSDRGSPECSDIVR